MATTTKGLEAEITVELEELLDRAIADHSEVGVALVNGMRHNVIIYMYDEKTLLVEGSKGTAKFLIYRDKIAALKFV